MFGSLYDCGRIVNKVIARSHTLDSLLTPCLLIFSSSYPDVFDPVSQGGTGMLSNNKTLNPDFAEYNKVYIRYCDGASYSGDLTDPLEVNGTLIYMRGKRIVHAILDDLRRKHGLLKASHVLISGCSAGGLAAYLHCDSIHHYIGSHAIVKCVPDAGFFTDLQAISGTYALRTEYQYLFAMQNASGGVDQDCIRESAGAEWKCFMPQYTLPFIETPVFVLNSGYDLWQASNVWFPAGPWGQIPDSDWIACALDITRCNDTQMTIVQNYYSQTIAAMQFVLNPQSITVGAFVNSCFVHCQTSEWTTRSRIGNVSIAQAVGDWFFDRVPTNESKRLMCRFPCSDVGSLCHG